MRDRLLSAQANNNHDGMQPRVQASRQIRSNPENSCIPIIALTAHKAPEDVTKALEAGINAYETQPVLYERLMKKIAALCRSATVPVHR